MAGWNFSDRDLEQIKSMGLSQAQVKAQLKFFQRSPYLKIQRPSRIGDGIIKIPSGEQKAFIRRQEKAGRESRFLKFIPASGAASRMFQTAFFFLYEHPSLTPASLRRLKTRGDPDGKEFSTFLSKIPRCPFFNDLKDALQKDGLDFETLWQKGNWTVILEYLLTEKGLNYGDLPKGLMKFYQYPEESRTALEEHLVEAARTIRDRLGISRIHLTVSPEHRRVFKKFLKTIQPALEKTLHTRFELSLSVQKPSTNTIALDDLNRPFRQADGSLLFRPGGHGSLLSNISDLAGDLIFIKNIDNVQPDRLKGLTLTWKKVLGGVLVWLEEKIRDYLNRLISEPKDPKGIEEAMAFAQNSLLIFQPPDFPNWSPSRRRGFLLKKLNRPIRVCGMVKNVKEPGGGPFWVEGPDGTLSPQIVEKAQVDFSSPEQAALWGSSTHFNPVDLVCSLRDYQGIPFDLTRFVDSQAVFLTRKSWEGRELRSLEWPGLWNGSMSDWITVLVEVPGRTFTPVKTVNDLLKPVHQPAD
jgi:hypothetical protein